MSRIGVILCAWQAEDMIGRCADAWLAARTKQLGGHEYVICAVSVPFESFPQAETRDRTRSIIGAWLQDALIDHAVVRDKPMKETEARGAALQWLVHEAKVDLTIQVDADEFYTAAEIERIFAFVDRYPLIVAFRGSLRNYVFDEHTCLVEPFTPMRIHRVRLIQGVIWEAAAFWDDNNVVYNDSWHERRDVEFATLTIPKGVAFVKHFSWLSDLRSKKKVEYQLSRGWTPTFLWKDDRLIFNPSLTAPETRTE